MFMLDVRGHGHEAIFNSEDTYHIFDQPLFAEWKHPTSLNGIPTLLYWDKVQWSDQTGTMVPKTTVMLLGHPPTLNLISRITHIQGLFLQSVG